MGLFSDISQVKNFAMMERSMKEYVDKETYDEVDFCVGNDEDNNEGYVA
ncbi:MAG: hypothetical protein LUG16_05755 [Candidatus Gastranaerophilales bacterium]|nr:hypothetical protein [Candidatus Gastranaerophilales bacterium]